MKTEDKIKLIENRINILGRREGNGKIINKAKRQLRKLKASL